MEGIDFRIDALQGKLVRRMVDVYHHKKNVLRVKKIGTHETDNVHPKG